MLVVTLDLSDTTVNELATFIDAALAVGADADTKLTVTDNQLRVEVAGGAPASTEKEEPEVVEEPRPSFDTSPLSDAVRQVVNEEAVRGLLGNLLDNRNPRRF